MTDVINLLTDEQLEAWAQALESGKYKQGRSALCSNGEYCCLGVWAKENGELNDDGYFKKDSANHDGLLRGLGDDQYYYLGGEQQHDLADRNDSGCTFHEIATYIRENLIGGAS